MLVLALVLAGCGGGGGGGAPAVQQPPAPQPVPNPPGGSSGWVQGQFLPAGTFAAQCNAPRSGVDPLTQQPYPDVQGTRVTENNWLRSWSNDTYLWYDEILDRDPGNYSTADYFALLKTTATTPSGNPKDKFHFTYRTSDWIQLSQAGVTAGYGLEWAVVESLPPRKVVAAYVQDGPGKTAGLRRGDMVVRVDGVDVINSNTQAAVNVFVAGLYPEGAGETHVFTVRDWQTGADRSVTMRSENVTMLPVPTVKTLPGGVGYLQFNDHVATAEQDLVTAIDGFRQAQITDLVLDLRYNGGGYLVLASELAYMIAGNTATAGRTFETLRFNDKHPSTDPITGDPLLPLPFQDRTVGLSAPPGVALPTLDLPRVFVLTGASTCSASESIINSLRGVNVQVIQIGSTTCGKPYGFHPAENCGTTYFAVQFKGVNAAGFGDYTDGFSPDNTAGNAGTRIPGCSVWDDFGHELGDPAEARLAAALNYRFGGQCPSPTGFAPPTFSGSGKTGTWFGGDGVVIKSPWLENRSLESR